MTTAPMLDSDLRSARRFKTKDRTGLLVAIMNALAGEASISFEGDLNGLSLDRLPGVSVEESQVLKRGTLFPKQDFVIVPLQPASIASIIKAFGGTLPRGILHVQIEKCGTLEFAAYDNFHPDCIVFGPGISGDVIAPFAVE